MPVCESVSRLLYPNAEVVVHDIVRDRIVAVWNPFSGRKVGDPSLLDELSEDEDQLMGPYAKVLMDGRRLTSVSAPLVDGEGIRRGLLCVNLDLSVLDDAVERLKNFVTSRRPRPPALFLRDNREQIALAVDEALRTRHWRRDSLSRAQRLDVVRVLHEHGLFATRKAAVHAARALGVSRTWIYTALAEIRSDPAGQTDPHP